MKEKEEIKIFLKKWTRVVTSKTFKNISLEEKQLLNFQILEGEVSG